MASPSSLLPVAAIPAPTCQVWVTSRATNNLTVIDADTSQTSLVNIGNSSWTVALTPDASKAIVATSFQGIKIVDVANNNAVSTIAQSSFVVGTSLDGTKFYSAGWSSGSLDEYSVATGQATGRSAPTDHAPTDFTMSPDGSFIYLPNYNSNPPTITKVVTLTMTSTNVPIANVPGNAGHLAGIGVSPDGQKLYAAIYGSDYVQEINASDMSVQRRVTTSTQPRDVVVNSSGTKIYVNSTFDGFVEVIDTSTFQITATIPAGSSPQKMAMSPDGQYLFVTNQFSDTVSKIDLSSNTVVDTIAVDPQPYGIAIGPDGCTTAAQQSPPPDPEPEPQIPPTSLWRIALDPSGGRCVVDGSSHDEQWTTMFVGYGYLPGPTDCSRDGFTLAGWADPSSLGNSSTLPLLIDPSDGEQRWFVAANHSLVAVWAQDEEQLDNYSGTSPGAFVGGPDRRTREGGGVVDGYYISPRTQFGLWMLAIR